MNRAVRFGVLVAVAALAVTAVLWWQSGAWQEGAMPTRGLLRVMAFAFGALACFGLARWLRRR